MGSFREILQGETLRIERFTGTLECHVSVTVPYSNPNLCFCQSVATEPMLCFIYKQCMSQLETHFNLSKCSSVLATMCYANIVSQGYFKNGMGQGMENGIFNRWRVTDHHLKRGILG